MPVRPRHLTPGQVGPNGNGSDAKMVGNVGNPPLLTVNARFEAPTAESDRGTIESVVARTDDPERQSGWVGGVWRDMEVGEEGGQVGLNSAQQGVGAGLEVVQAEVVDMQGLHSFVCDDFREVDDDADFKVSEVEHCRLFLVTISCSTGVSSILYNVWL